MDRINNINFNSSTKPYKTCGQAQSAEITLFGSDKPANISRINGQFIHGNNNPASLGTYASLGCVRMDNGVIKKLAQEVERNTYVLIK